MSEPIRGVAVSNLGEAEHELQIEGSDAEWRIESPAEMGVWKQAGIGVFICEISRKVPGALIACAACLGSGR